MNAPKFSFSTISASADEVSRLRGPGQSAESIVGETMNSDWPHLQAAVIEELKRRDRRNA
jgi:hypothetical protein